MASLFRTSKWEDPNDFEVFRAEQRKKTILRKDKDNKLIYGDDEEEKEGEGDGGEGDGQGDGAVATDGEQATVGNTAGDDKKDDEKKKDDD